MANRSKNKQIVKNTISLRHSIEKKQEQLEDKHAYIKERMPKLFENINRITSLFDGDSYLNMSSKDATYYIPNRKDFEKKKVEPLNNVEKTYKELNHKLYQKIIARPKQTGMELQDKNIKSIPKLNFSESKSYNNFTFQSVKEAMENIQKTGKAVVYDLETYGGTNKEGVWAPRGITEYSFQTVDVEGYKRALNKDPQANILDHIQKETAVIGWTKEERDKWVDKINHELAKNGGEIKDEELRVTALRLQLYGNAEGSVNKKNGITKVTKFAGEEAYIGGLDKEAIERGADFLHQAYKDASLKKTANGILPYHEKFFKSISGIIKNDNTLLDFNGINFDMKILNSQLSDLYYNTYGQNEQAQRAIATMFGYDPNKALTDFKGPGIHLESNRRVDISGVFKTASDIAGLKSVYGNHYEEVLNDFNKTRLNRQEIYGEAMLKGIDGVMDKSTRHLAEQDTTVAALMAIMENKNFPSYVSDVGPLPANRPKNISALDHAMMTIQQAVDSNKITTTTIDQSNMANKIFMSKGSLITPGRSMLNFTAAPDGTIKTASNYIIGEGIDHLKALGGVEKAGYNVSANPVKGLLYKVSDMFEVDMDSDLVKEMTKSMPEYASNKVFGVKVDTYLPDNLKEKYAEFNNSHYMFFTDKAEAEKYMSDAFDFLGSEEKATGYLKDFDVNNVVRNRVQVGTEEAQRIKYKKIRNRKDWDIAKAEVDNLIANGVDIKPLGDYQTKTVSREISRKRKIGEFDAKVPGLKNKADIVEGAPIWNESDKDFKNVHPGRYKGNWVKTDKTKKQLIAEGYNEAMILDGTAGTQVFKPYLKDVKKPQYETYKEKISYEIGNGKNYAPVVKSGQPVYEAYQKPVYKNGVVIGKDGKPINEKDLYSKKEYERINFTPNAKDSITYVDVTKPKVKTTINADGTTEQIDVIEKHYGDVYEYLDETLSKKSKERANNAFNRDTYKSSNKFNDLLSQMFDGKKEINPVEVKTKLEQARSISHQLSREVANGKPLTAKTLKDKLGYDLIGTLGFNSQATNEKHLISSTLNNFIQSAEKYVELNDVFKDMKGLIDVKHSDKAASLKFDSMLDYMLNDYMEKEYTGPIKTPVKLTKKEMKNVFEVNVEGFRDERTVDNLQHNIYNTLEDKYIKRINLKSGPGSLSKDVSKMLFGDRGKTVDANAREAYAMRQFVEHMHKQNPSLFESNDTLKNLVSSIKEERMGTKFSLETNESAGKFIAEELIRGLKQHKEDYGYSQGIIKKTFSNSNILDDEKARKGFVKYVKDNESLIKDAYKNTSSIVRYDFGGVNDFNPSSPKTAMSHINKIVDDIFMPTVNGLNGDAALKYIKENSNYNDVQKDYIETLWNKSREAHINTVNQIHQLVQNTGGVLMTVDGQLAALHGDQVIAFKDLAKTRYDYNTLYHNVGPTNVVAKLQYGLDKDNKNILESNLTSINRTLRTNKNMIERAKKDGTWRPELINNFKGKVTNKMREESVISTFNAHERKRQFEIDIATEAFGNRLKKLVGVDDTEAVWGEYNTLTNGVVSLVKDEIERIQKTGRKFDPETLSPQIIEALGKEIIPLLGKDINTSEEFKRYLGHMSASAKDKDMSKHLTFVVDEDRYAQAALNSYDNPQRPTLQAGKIDYSVERTEAGLQRYNEMVQNRKQVINGTLFDTPDSNRRITGKGVGEIDSAITVKKVNAGNLAVRSVIENEFSKVMKDNNISEATKKAEAKMFALLFEVPNLQEQEKIMDARLMDSVFNQAANTQYIAHKDLVSYYRHELSTNDWSRAPKNKVEKAKRDEARKLINVISGNMLKISKDENGELVVKTPSGSLVKRGDTVMNYYDKYSSGTVNSKIDIGRFQHGVFEKAGNVQLSDEQIKSYLKNNLDITKLSGEELEQKAYQLLDQEFNFKFFVSDIEQQSYGKYMDGAVEKDMTNGLYVKLGQLDESVRNKVAKAKYKGISGKDLLDKVIRINEVEEIFKHDPKLIQAIKDERYTLSKKMFDEFEQFKDASLIANHQTAKHKNYGLITDGVIGNIYDKLLTSGQAKDKENATEILMNKLSEYDVFDKKNTELEIKNGSIFIKPIDDKAAKKVVNKYKMDGENILEDVKSLNISQLQKMMREDDIIGSLGLYHKEVSLFDANKNENVVMKNVYGDLGKIKSADNKDLVISKSFATLQQAVDPETMTVYDYQTVKALGVKRQAEKHAIEANMFVNKKLEKLHAQGVDITEDVVEQVKREKGFKMHFDKARELHAEADFILGDMENISKVKTIGRQEMRIYNNKVFNYATENVANRYIQEAKAKGTDEFEAAKKYVENFYGGILENNGNDHYELVDEFRNKGAYENVTKDIIKQKMFKEGDIEITDDILNYGGKGYLRDVYNKAKRVATQEFQEDAKISLRYAEELFQADSAHIAQKFNSASGHIDINVLKDKGFQVVGLGDQSHLIDGVKSLNTVGESSVYGFNSIFNSNTLLYLGEDIAGAGPDNPAGYLAVPKAGKILENNTISTMFQNKLKTLNETYAEYQQGGGLVKGSKEQEDKLQSLKDQADNIKELIRVHTYEKGGAIHDLGKFEMDEAFRLKFSFANNSHLVDNVGSDSIISEIIDKGDSALKTAKINGKSIFELEKQGALLDYAFVGSNIFEKLGYFEKENLDKYGMSADEMKQHLKENGIIANTGRYPMIMDDSEKATRIYLNDDITTKNRARVSVATALAMNADNDGDSASFGVFKLTSGNTYNDYQIAKIRAQKELPDGSYNEIKEHIIKNSNISEYDVKAFRSMEADLANASIGINKFYNDKSLDDIRGELVTSIKNGTLNETMDSLTYNNLYRGMMYANAGSSQNEMAIKKNADKIDNFISTVSSFDNKIAKMRRVDIGEHADFAGGLDMAEYFDNVLGAVGSYDNKGNLILNSAAKEAGITEQSAENFRQYAVARTKWFDSLKEAQAKSRKGSIGPVNVGMQGIRAAGEVLYDDLGDVSQQQKKNISNWVAYELEEEVIGAKHGSVVNNITKAKDLNSLVNNVIYGNREVVATKQDSMQELRTWLNGGVRKDGKEIEANLSDKAVNNIWKRLESSGKVTEKDLPSIPFVGDEESATMARRRSFVVNTMEEVLNNISSSEKAKEAMKANKIGGSGADHNYVMGRNRSLTLDDVNGSILNLEGFDNSVTKRANAELADTIPIAHGATGTSDTMMEAGAAVSNKILKMTSGKGLAMAALGVAGMTLVAGYAGGPLPGGGASAREQEESNNQSTVPMMMDQGEAVVRNSNRGYIINIKANSNQDMKQTKRAMRQAAQAASGGVNVNMTVRNKDAMISNNDIEQFLTGL